MMLVACLVMTLAFSNECGKAPVRPSGPVSTNELGDYSNYLESLTAPDVLSIREAKKYYMDHFPKCTQPVKDAAFVQFRAFYLGAIALFTKAHPEVLERQKGVFPSPEDLKSCGLRVFEYEGQFYVAETPDFLYKVSCGYVSKSLSPDVSPDRPLARERHCVIAT